MTVTHVAQVPAADPSTASSQKTRPQPATPTTDTVQISSSAVMAAKAAVQEVTETEAQTVKDAQAGDRQAQRLMAKYSTK